MEEGMKKTGRIAWLATIALVCAGVSSADSISYNATFGPATTDYTNGAMSLRLFDPSLGTLNAVVLALGIQDTITSLELKNTSTGNQGFRFLSQVSADTISGPSVSPTDLVFVPTFTVFDTHNITLGGTVSGPGLCVASTPNGSCNDVFYTPPNRTASSSAFTVVPLGNRVNYLDCASCTNSFTIVGETTTFSTFIGGGGNIQASQTTNATLTATVTYFYDPPNYTTPEPTTMLLAGSALVGIGLLRRKIRT